RGQTSAYGIDSECKQPVEFGTQALQIEHPLARQIPIKSLEVPDVKNDPVTLGNGSLIERISLHYSKQLIGAPACRSQLIQQIVANEGIALGLHKTSTNQRRRK